MIKITSGKMTIPENERFIGFVGDNLHSTKIFHFTDVDDTGCEYRLSLEFCSGTKKDILLDSKVENNSTYLYWTISEKDIIETGIIYARIKVTYPDSKIYHTESGCFVAAPIDLYELDNSNTENNSDILERKLNGIISQINGLEINAVPKTRTIAGLRLENDITAQLLTESLNTYPVLKLSYAPTVQTEGKIGQLAFERSTTNGIDFNNRLYFCSHINSDGGYVWYAITPEKGADGKSGVYVGTDEPTDENISVWIDPEGGLTEITGFVTKEYVDNLFETYDNNILAILGGDEDVE